MSFSTAGTGGFGVLGSSAVTYSSSTQIILAVFMFLFSLNFNIYYLLLIGNVRKAFAIEEIKAYTIMTIVSVVVIAVNIFTSLSNVYLTFGDAIKHSFFQVTSIASTTGLSSTDFDKWPALSKGILMLLTVVGACGGSTGGGLKVSRMLILCKSASADFKKQIHSRAVITPRLEGDPIDDATIRNTRTFLVFWILVVVASTLLLSLDPNLKANLFSNFSATLACIGNVGPGFDFVGPMCNYAGYSDFSTIILSLVMLIGRLEIFPMLILFIPRTWKKG